MAEASPQDQGNGLFRLAAVEQAGAADTLDLGVHVVRAPQWILLAVALALSLGAVIFSLVLTVPSKVDAKGILITAEGLKNIESVSGGRVRDIFVSPGDVVRRGQKIAQIEQPDLGQQLEQAQAELSNLHNRYDRVVGFQGMSKADTEAMLTQKRRELENLIAANRKQTDWLQKNLAGYEDLTAKGYASQQKLFEARVKLNEAQAELMRNTNALNALAFDDNTRKIEREREILDLEIKIEQARAQVSAIREKRQRMAFVESPYDGVVIEQKLNLGELIEVGKPIVSVLPGGEAEDQDGHQHIPLVATLYLPSSDGKRVQTGMKVHVVPSTVKREEYGFIYGEITSVAAAPATPEGMMRSLKNKQLVDSLSTGGAPFEATATLAIDHDTPSGFRWSSSKGPDQSISAGSMATAQVIVKEQPLIALVMPAIRRMMGDLAR